MRRIIAITVLAVIFFVIEFFLFNILGDFLQPHLLLLLVIFFNLFLGIRFGLYTAVISGILYDSFATTVFGLNIVSFIICAYMTTLLRRRIYYRGSQLSRLIMVFCIYLIDFFTRVILYSMLGSFDPLGAFKFALLPALVTTLFVTTTTFQYLRQCVSRLFV